MNDFVTGRFVSDRHAAFEREAERDALAALATSAAGSEAAPPQPRRVSVLVALVRRWSATDRRAIAAARGWVRSRAGGGTRI